MGGVLPKTNRRIQNAQAKKKRDQKRRVDRIFKLSERLQALEPFRPASYFCTYALSRDVTLEELVVRFQKRAVEAFEREERRLVKNGVIPHGRP